MIIAKNAFNERRAYNILIEKNNVPYLFVTFTRYIFIWIDRYSTKYNYVVII